MRFRAVQFARFLQHVTSLDVDSTHSRRDPQRFLVQCRRIPEAALVTRHVGSSDEQTLGRLTIPWNKSLAAQIDQSQRPSKKIRSTPSAFSHAIPSVNASPERRCGGDRVWHAADEERWATSNNERGSMRAGPFAPCSRSRISGFNVNHDRALRILRFSASDNARKPVRPRSGQDCTGFGFWITAGS